VDICKKMKDVSKIPTCFQGVLWSTKIKNLDLEKDKVYIINQILSCGTWPMIKWLFHTYSDQTVNNVFLRHPIKDYSFSRFNLVEKYLLGVKDLSLDPKRYVKNLPRDIR